MKILMVLSNPFVNDSRVFNEATSLIEAGHQVSLIAWDRLNKHKRWETIKGIKVYRIHNNVLMRALVKLFLQMPFFWWKAVRQAKQIEFEVIHCHDLDTLKVGLKLKIKYGTKLIYDAHEIYPYLLERDLSKFFIPFFRRIERQGVKSVNGLLLADESYIAYFKSLSYNNFETILNTKEFYLNSYQPTDNKVFTISYVGTLNPSRFILELLEIVSEIPDVRLIVAGRGRLASRIQKFSKLYQNIEFLGEIDFDKIIPLTHQCDLSICMINPNDRNNQLASANKQFETMVAGRPIIATKNTRSGEITTQEKCGLVIDYNKTELKKAVEFFRDNPEECKKMGKNALKAAQQKYNWEVDKEKLVKFYSNLEK